MVSQREIKANPAKIDAIINLPQPCNLRELQRLTSRMAVVNRFIVRSADKGLLFFKALKRHGEFNWTDECQIAFEMLKRYLTNPQLLAELENGEILYLYLAASDVAVRITLVKEASHDYKPMYYINNTLQDG